MFAHAYFQISLPVTAEVLEFRIRDVLVATLIYKGKQFRDRIFDRCFLDQNCDQIYISKMGLVSKSPIYVTLVEHISQVALKKTIPCCRGG